jgi:hypothetical protein
MKSLLVAAVFCVLSTSVEAQTCTLHTPDGDVVVTPPQGWAVVMSNSGSASLQPQGRRIIHPYIQVQTPTWNELDATSLDEYVAQIRRDNSVPIKTIVDWKYPGQRRVDFAFKIHHDENPNDPVGDTQEYYVLHIGVKRPGGVVEIMMLCATVQELQENEKNLVWVFDHLGI